MISGGASGLRWFTVAVYLLAVVLTVPFGRLDYTFSMAFGGFLALSSLLYLEHFLGTVFSYGISAPLAKSLTLFSFYVRYVVIAFVTYMVITKSQILNVPMLIAGLSVTVFSIFTWGLLLKPKETGEGYERAN